MATALLVAGSTLTFWIPPFASTSSCSKEPGCLYNFMRLAYGSFQLTHMSRHDHAVQLIELWRPKRRQYITTALTKFPKGWVSACKHQCTTAITTMWTESLWAFSESYTANDSWIVHSSNGDQRKTKALRTPQPRWVSAQLLYVLVNARRRSRWLSQNLRRPFLRAGRFDF